MSGLPFTDAVFDASALSILGERASSYLNVSVVWASVLPRLTITFTVLLPACMQNNRSYNFGQNILFIHPNQQKTNSCLCNSSQNRGHDKNLYFIQYKMINVFH